MRRSRTFIALFAAFAVGLLGLLVSPAQAAGPPSVTFFPAPLPIVGSTLSDSTDYPMITTKDGWSINDAEGVCTANAQVYQNGAWRVVWTFNGNASTKGPITGKVQVTHDLELYTQIAVYARDCLGNEGWTYDGIYSNLYQQGVASYSAGWTTGACACWSGGSVLKSTKIGATATFQFEGWRLVTAVLDKGPGRGKVGIYIDGVLKKTLDLAAATTTNRLIAWNSGYLSTGSHTLTLKVVSGRIDVDGFIVQY